MSEGRRGGERRQHTQPSVCTHVGTRDCRPRQGTRPSLGPSTRARQSSLCSAAKASEVGQPKQHRGRANLRKQEGTGTGVAADGRSAARHVSPLPQGRGREAQKKRKEVEASVPARIEELGFGCSHVETQLQKSVSDVRSRISSANALQKERSGSSERGPSSSQKSAGETVGGCGGRKDES